MSCAMEVLLAALLPFTGPDYTVYKTALSREGFEKVQFPQPLVCDAASFVIASNKGLAPYETEAPIGEIERKLRSVPGIQTRVLVNRAGPFYGYYVQVTRKPQSGTAAAAQPGT